MRRLRVGGYDSLNRYGSALSAACFAGRGKHLPRPVREGVIPAHAGSEPHRLTAMPYPDRQAPPGRSAVGQLAVLGIGPQGRARFRWRSVRPASRTGWRTNLSPYSHLFGSDSPAPRHGNSLPQGGLMLSRRPCFFGTTPTGSPHLTTGPTRTNLHHTRQLPMDCLPDEAESPLTRETSLAGRGQEPFPCVAHGPPSVFQDRIPLKESRRLGMFGRLNR